jgi:hypothetical protein
MNQLQQHHTQLIKEQAKLLGFDFVESQKLLFGRRGTLIRKVVKQ